VESRRLTRDGVTLQLGPVGTETVVQSVDGIGMVGSVAPGDWVSMAEAFPRSATSGMARVQRAEATISEPSSAGWACLV
jgi:hypothetical protein